MRSGRARPAAASDFLLKDAARARLLEAIRTVHPGEALLSVARGPSNPETAAHLVVTEATVKSHIGSLFAKLQLRDRAQAVVFAYENGFVLPGTSG